MGTADLLIGILRCDRPVSDTWQKALDALETPEGLTAESVTLVNAGESKSGEIDRARNELCERARGHRYLFFLDDDVIPPPDALVKLVDAFKERPKARVIGGIYPRRNLNRTGDMLVFKGSYEDGTSDWIMSWEPGSVFPCTALPSGAMLIDAHVFDEIPEPWFRTIWFRRRAAVPEGYISRRITEDFYFCRQVLNAGFEVWAHGGVVCEHRGPIADEYYSLSQL